jgi:ribose transport system substrate-binding protein
MKKNVLLILVLALSCVSFTFAGGQSDGGMKSIAVIMPSADHGFLGESIVHAENATKLLADEKGYKYQFLISDDVVEQANQIDTVVAQGADVVVLWPHNGDELKSSAQTVVDAGIPLIIYDRLISNFNETAELLGDNVTIGEDMGVYFNEYYKNELAAGIVNILEFKGDNSSVPTQRSEGFWSTASSKFNKVNDYVTNWSKDKAQTQMETFLSSSTKEQVESIQGLFTHDADVAAGVQVAYSFSPAMVVDAIKLGVDVLDGKKVSGQYLVATEMVDNGNYKKFMKGPVYTLRYSLY